MAGKLLTVMNDRGLDNVVDLAAAAKISLNTARLALRTGKISPGSAFKIAHALKVDVLDIFPKLDLGRQPRRASAEAK